MTGDSETKYFVLDTNVLLHDSDAIYAFGDNHVVIPIDVLEELDKFKSENTEIGRNARAVIRTLDHLRERGCLGRGVTLDGNGKSGFLQVDTQPISLADIGLERSNPDHRIMSVAYKLLKAGHNVVFVSKDINVRIKSDAIGITAMDFEKEKIAIDSLYRGWREIEVDGGQLDAFLDGETIATDETFHPNEMLLLRNVDRPKQTALGRSGREPGQVTALRHSTERVSGIKPRNLEQTFALELLLDDSIPLVTLVGRAGTGKTLLALAAGYNKVVRDAAYDKILVARPIMPLGRDIGYLPGTKDEKLEQWMKPIFDNMKVLLRSRRDDDSTRRIGELFKQNVLEMEALTYIRGRSIVDQFLIVDEAQNLTPHEVKTIISRAGDDTKLVLTGDPYQIDNPYLDSDSNGLSYVAERMKAQPIAGHMLMQKSERSRLASVAAELL